MGPRRNYAIYTARANAFRARSSAPVHLLSPRILLSLRILPVTIALLLLAVPALGQFTRDEAANKKIREAIDTHYLATDFDKAEAQLLGTIQACEKKCSPQVLAKAWMYVGIVRSGGKNNPAGAKQAFQSALALDPTVKLDIDLATANAQKAFQEAGGTAEAGTAAPPAPTEEPAADAAEPAPVAEGVGLDCTPKVAEVETRRPIPVECRAAAEATSLELRFKPSGEDWQSLTMTRKGETFRAQIPCDKTNSGSVKLFVRAKDASGDEIAGWATKANPILISLVEVSTQEPPSFDDADAPARCEAKEDCPPNFPGCNAADERPTTSDSGASKNWVGLHIAQDLAFVGGTDVCTQAKQNDESFACYYAGSRTGAFIDEPYPGTETSTSLVFATTRILISYDRAFTPHLLLGVRLGYALGGGPPAGRNVVYNRDGSISEVLAEGLAFLPFHVEGRASYWFGADVLAKKGFRPYAHVGGGLAQVDAKTETSVKDCGLSETVNYAQCAGGEVPADDPGLVAANLDVWKKLGKSFITIGGGFVYAFTKDLGAQLNLNLMYTLPITGLVIEPSLGAVMGF